MSRSLASVQTVEALVKHPNADSLWLATVLGWSIAVREGEVEVGDKIVYLEIDSMVPIDAEWLPPAVKDRIVRDNIQEFFRIKTIKLRGLVSQGLLVPLSKFANPSDFEAMDVGTDVTELLGVTKYSRRQHTSGGRNRAKNASTFPTHLVSKTDETRIQGVPRYLSIMAGTPFYIAEKADGCSATFLVDPESREFTVCSRNMIRVGNPDCQFWAIARKYRIEEAVSSAPIAIQGELCGPGIQKNLMGFKDRKLLVFNVVDLATRQRYGWDQLQEFCSHWGFETVRLVHRGNSFDYPDVESLVTLAKGTYAGTKNHREGLVVRSDGTELNVSFKVINNDYLLKHD